jgi:hypothetical protein
MAAWVHPHPFCLSHIHPLDHIIISHRVSTGVGEIDGHDIDGQFSLEQQLRFAYLTTRVSLRNTTRPFDCMLCISQWNILVKFHGKSNIQNSSTEGVTSSRSLWNSHTYLCMSECHRRFTPSMSWIRLLTLGHETRQHGLDLACSPTTWRMPGLLASNLVNTRSAHRQLGKHMFCILPGWRNSCPLPSAWRWSDLINDRLLFIWYYYDRLLFVGYALLQTVIWLVCTTTDWI